MHFSNLRCRVAVYENTLGYFELHAQITVPVLVLICVGAPPLAAQPDAPAPQIWNWYALSTFCVASLFRMNFLRTYFSPWYKPTVELEQDDPSPISKLEIAME